MSKAQRISTTPDAPHTLLMRWSDACNDLPNGFTPSWGTLSIYDILVSIDPRWRLKGIFCRLHTNLQQTEHGRHLVASYPANRAAFRAARAAQNQRSSTRFHVLRAESPNL